MSHEDTKVQRVLVDSVGVGRGTIFCAQSSSVPALIWVQNIEPLHNFPFRTIFCSKVQRVLVVSAGVGRGTIFCALFIRSQLKKNGGY